MNESMDAHQKRGLMPGDQDLQTPEDGGLKRGSCDALIA